MKTKLFKATIQNTDSQLEKAISLPGWSHASTPFDGPCGWYPWSAEFRHVYFSAPNRTQAARQCDKRDIYIRDLCHA